MDDNFLIIKNPNEAFRKDLVRRIVANGGYCPSRKEKTLETKCHCEEYKRNLNCICGLFIRIPCYEVKEC